MKSNLDKLFKTDADLEKNGVWFELSEETGFLLRPFKSQNPRVKAAMAQHYKPYARLIELGTLEIEKQNEINIKLFINACLVDWKGVEIDGAVVACDKDNALKLFLALPELFQTLWKHVNDYQNYKEELGNF